MVDLLGFWEKSPARWPPSLVVAGRSVCIMPELAIVVSSGIPKDD